MTISLSLSFFLHEGLAVVAGGGGGGATVAMAPGGPLNGVQGIVGGALNLASSPLNTITATLNSIGIPTLATAPINAVSSFIQQAGGTFGR